MSVSGRLLVVQLANSSSCNILSFVVVVVRNGKVQKQDMQVKGRG